MKKYFRQGKSSFNEKSDSDALYITADGEGEIIVNPSLIQALNNHPANNSVKTTLSNGPILGEIALVYEDLSSASTRVTKDETRLLVIDRNRLVMLCETYPPLGFRLMYNLAADLAMKNRNTDLRMRENMVNSTLKDKK